MLSLGPSHGRVLGALVLVLGLAACGDPTAADPAGEGEPTTSDVGPEFANVEWEDWTATYRDVRPAADPELEDLAERARALNQTSWHADLGPRSFSIVYTPELVRVDLIGTDVYLDPRGFDGQESALTVCAETCVETSLADRGPGPEGDLVPEDFNSALYLLAPQLPVDRFADQVREYGKALLGTLDSPVGTLQCFLAVQDGTTPEDVEGQPLDLDPTSEGGFTPAACVDERGLLFSPPGGNLAARYESWFTGVDGDVQPTPAVEAEASEEPDDASTTELVWEDWDPEYRHARMATPEDLDALNASSWTATMPEGGCAEQEVTEQTDEGDFLSAISVVFVEWLQAQRTAGLTLTEETAYAVLDSPIGTLECVVDLGKADVRNLEGTRPDSGWGEPRKGIPNEDRGCVDEHGVVLLTEAVRQAPLLQLLDWTDGVPRGFDEHAEAEQR